MLCSANVEEDDRIARRVSDATRARIDELAGGWTIDMPTQAKDAPPPAKSAAQLDDPGQSMSMRPIARPTTASPGTGAPPGSSVARDTTVGDASPRVKRLTAPASSPVRDGSETIQIESADRMDPSDPTSPTTVRRLNTASSTNPPTTRPPDTGAMLPRTRGILGDIRYVATVLFGVRRVKRELQAAEAKQLLRLASRQHHLTTLARHAVVIEDYDHPAIRQARDALRNPEEARAKHTAAVAAGNAELDRIRRNRETTRAAFAAAVTATETELAELTKQLQPLVRQAAAARRRAADLSDQIRAIGRQIAKAELRLASASENKVDPVAVQAEIAAYRAEQQAIERDQVKIASELDALRPQIEALRTARRSTQAQRRDVEAQDKEDHVRTTELLEAAGARRKIDDRGTADAELARDKILLELGQRLHGEHPTAFSAQFGPIDQIDQEIGEADQRIADLNDMLVSVDRSKFVRGCAAIAMMVAAAGAGVWLVV